MSPAHDSRAIGAVVAVRLDPLTSAARLARHMWWIVEVDAWNVSPRMTRFDVGAVVACD